MSLEGKIESGMEEPLVSVGGDCVSGAVQPVSGAVHNVSEGGGVSGSVSPHPATNVRSVSVKPMYRIRW